MREGLREAPRVNRWCQLAPKELWAPKEPLCIAVLSSYRPPLSRSDCRH